MACNNFYPAEEMTMRKRLLFFCCFVLLLFLLPPLAAQTREGAEQSVPSSAMQPAERLKPSPLPYGFNSA